MNNTDNLAVLPEILESFGVAYTHPAFAFRAENFSQDVFWSLYFPRTMEMPCVRDGFMAAMGAFVGVHTPFDPRSFTFYNDYGVFARADVTLLGTEIRFVYKVSENKSVGGFDFFLDRVYFRGASDPSQKVIIAV